MKKTVLSHLEKDIKKSIEDDIVRVLDFHERTRIGGYHSIPRLVFCYIDYLGSLLYGNSSTANGIRFIEEYFPEQYKEVSALMFCMWRHGTIHEYDPKVLRHNKTILGWLENISSKQANKKDHLNIFKNKNKLVLGINENRLVEDLLIALKGLIGKINKKEIKVSELQRNYKNISSLVDLDKLQVNGEIKKKIKSQFQVKVKHVVGVINSRGDVIKRL